jgi:hypothetical protein
MLINNTKDLRDAVRAGKYAWPGGYPRYFIAADGEALSFDAVRAEYRQVLRAVKYPRTDTQWQVACTDINWENPDLYCAHTGERIESAYAEDGTDETSEA